MRIIFFIAVFAFIVTNLSGQNRYEIIGTAKGLSDNTVLFLELIGEKSINSLDSTFVTGEKFVFKGEIKSEAAYCLIRTRNFSDYKFFWVENKPIIFNAVKGNFREALISGSNTQDEQNRLNTLTHSLPEKDRKNIELQFIREHPKSIISAHLLSVYCTDWGKETISGLFNTLSNELKSTSYGIAISKFLSLNKDIRIGGKYVDFSQEDTGNKVVKLSDFSDKVVLLEFWGSWCGPCRKSNPELVRIYNEYKDKGFEIFGVGAETKRQFWLKAIEEDKLTWTNVTELKGDKNEASLIYGVSYYPTNFLIDRTGTIVGRDLEGEKLRKALQDLLDK
jgi:thiol-disulfide isomerase/thioredoxin